MPQFTGVIDAIAFPPLGTLQPVLDTGGPYYAGSNERDTFTTNGAFLLPAGTYQVHGTYGVVVVINGSIPITWGYEIGFGSGGAIGDEGWRYDNRICQLVPMHQLFTGVFAPMDYIDVHYLPYMTLWPFRLIGGDRLGLYVSPGIAVDLYYLCVL